MLVLSRKVGERILIGEGVVIELIRIRGNQIQLGIQAPKETKVWRQEVYLRMEQEQNEQDG